MHLDKQCVVVAIYLDAYEVEEISTCLALRPQALATATPECHLLRIERLLVSLLIHVAEHEHVFRIGILYYGGYKSAAFLKIYLHFSIDI